MWPIDRMRRAADFTDALGQDIDAGFDLGRLFVEQQMVVAEMRTADVPMKILGFDVQRERIRQQPVERLGHAWMASSDKSVGVFRRAAA